MTKKETLSEKCLKLRDGFSLVELAVVLVIIGIIVAGVLKGRDLIENARLKRVISEVHEIQVAMSSFLDKFEALPGDFKKASLLIQSDLKDGNGDGIIGGDGLDTSSEAFAAWSHLAESHFYEKIDTKERTAEFGKGSPSSSVGGGFTIESNPKNLKGHWIILGNKNGKHGDGGLLTPTQAFTLDQKMDDGKANSGRVRVMDGSDASSGDCVKPDGSFNLENEGPVCVMYFQI
ncbi:Type II secretion system GspH family domain protein [Candidatus Bealeia paramacronuclearis]|uniref:Type II secretion system GspH family domain protein n=1 Tax=Candidatus Bealeia paramacronuclearis TaxID=1921001 RepID=A0ABZ2C3X3_9PROT|nr:Type II secretion system GspH family domain protein [Candidatus Bealeia paramacronuclearis]